MTGSARFDALPKHEQELALRCLEWALSPAAAQVDLNLSSALRRSARRGDVGDDKILLMAYRLVVQGYAKRKRNDQPGGASRSTPAQGAPPSAPSAPSTPPVCPPSASRLPPVTDEPLAVIAARILEAQLVEAPPTARAASSKRRRAQRGGGRWRR